MNKITREFNLHIFTFTSKEIFTKHKLNKFKEKNI